MKNNGVRLLLCTDGSGEGLRAVVFGGAIAAQLKAGVTVLYASEREPRDDDVDEPQMWVAHALESSGVDFDLIERRGKLLEQILAELIRKDYDLVVVGYHARHFLEKALWGSVAARIAQELPSSVLIVRGRRESINHVLIGISGGGFTNECVKWGGIIAGEFDAHVTLLHVSPPPPLMYGGLGEVAETLIEFLQTETSEAQALKFAVGHLTETGVKADVEFVHGFAERALLRYAQDQDVDLLVIGSSWAAQPVHRFLARNIAEQVLLNTQRPVLVVRPADT